jgi:hypothetical protein
MGEGTNGLMQRHNGVDGSSDVADPNDGKSVQQLEQKVGLIREHLTDVVSELDYRRHELMDVKGQLRKHAGLIAGIAGGAVLIAGGIIGFSVYRSRTRPPPRYVRVDKVQQPESVGHRIATVAAGAIVGVLAKGLAMRFLKPAIEGREEDLPALPD